MGRCLSGGQVHDVLIAEVGAHAPRRLEKAHAPQDFIAIVVGRVPHQVSALQATAMRQQIANGQLARDVRIVHLDIGEVRGGGIVPSHLALVDEHGDERRRKRLRRRADREERMLIDRLGVAHRACAVTLHEHDRIVLDDGNREPGNLPVLHRLRDVLVEAGERSLWRRFVRRCLLPRRLLSERGRGGRECSKGERGSHQIAGEHVGTSGGSRSRRANIALRAQARKLLLPPRYRTSGSGMRSRPRASASFLAIPR